MQASPWISPFLRAFTLLLATWLGGACETDDACRDDYDCAEALVCKVSSGACESMVCKADTECEAGERCQDNACVAK